MDKKLKDIPKREKGRVRESWRHFGASAGYYRNTNESIHTYHRNLDYLEIS